MIHTRLSKEHAHEHIPHDSFWYRKLDPHKESDMQLLPVDMVNKNKPYRSDEVIAVCCCGFVSWHMKRGSFDSSKSQAKNKIHSTSSSAGNSSTVMCETSREEEPQPERYELVEYNEMKRKYVELEKEKEMVEQKLAKTEELCRVQGQVLFGIYRFLINRLPSIWFPDDVKLWFASRDRNLYFDPFLHNVIGSRTTLDGLTFLTCLFKLPRVPELHASVKDSLDVLSDPIPIPLSHGSWVRK